MHTLRRLLVMAKLQRHLMSPGTSLQARL
ncbi:rCG42062 [Rattus norvegicus]|uniref:RCG42062 n=1 Tax=Rattus norvegicus TaxID=10116 RepID=A6JV20_RAT|nr:rCG42062 [Rattus norvegicus]